MYGYHYTTGKRRTYGRKQNETRLVETEDRYNIAAAYYPSKADIAAMNERFQECKGQFLDLTAPRRPVSLNNCSREEVVLNF